MATGTREPMAAGRSLLEDFVRDYVETIGGAWDEVEPQVYDLLLPPELAESRLEGGEQHLLRIAFDPEAIPEHSGAQLASFGAPLVDRMLADAVRRGRYARLHTIGLNLAPHDLAGRVRRAVTLAPPLALHVERVRPLDFPQAVFWFQVTFVTDQKEQDILSVALDLHYLRQVRHLDQLLDPSHLAEKPSLFLPEVCRVSTATAYPAARDRVVRTIAALANTRRREQSERVERQIARMIRYYADLRNELEEQVARVRDRGEDIAKFSGRRDALDREERLRVAELRHKSSLGVHLRLLGLLVIHQPKLLVRSVVQSPDRASGTLDLVWDPLTELLEAAPCPACRRPTFAFELTRQSVAVCPACKGAPQPPSKPSRSR